MSFTRRRALKTIAGGLGAVCLASAFPRGAEAAKRVKRSFTLLPTQDGLEARFRGKVKTEARPDVNQERIWVRVEATLEPGTQVDVYAVNPINSPDPVLLGTITLLAHKKNRSRGELELKNFDGGTPPPAGVSPVPSISDFLVKPHNSQTIVLQTDFLPPGGGGGGGGGGGKEIILVPTAHGAATGTSGAALTARSDDKQRFRVEVESTGLPANSIIEIRFSHLDHGSNLFAGQFLLLRRSNRVEVKVEWDSLDGPAPPGQSLPVDEITSVTVIRVSNGEVLLTGAF